MSNKRTKSFALATLFLFLLLFREVCHWERDDDLHAEILACLHADAGGEQDGGVLLVTISAVVPVPPQTHHTMPVSLRDYVFSCPGGRCCS